MSGSTRSGLLRPIAVGPFLAALCLGAAASAQAPAQEAAPSQYICLTNSCFKPAAAPAPRLRDGAVTQATSISPASRQAMQAGLASGILDSLADEERASARLSQTVDGNLISTRVEFERADGTRGTRTVTINMAPNRNAP